MCFSKVLLELNETGMVFSLKKEQESAMPHIFNGKDVMAILLTGFGKSLIFQLFVTMCRVRSKRKEEFASLASLLFLRCKVLFKVLLVLSAISNPARIQFVKYRTKKFTTPPERSCLKCLRFHPVRSRAKYFQVSCSWPLFLKHFI